MACPHGWESRCPRITSTSSKSIMEGKVSSAKTLLFFFKAEELADFNREYEVEKYAPGILLFASDGGGEGYGFDTEDAAMPIVRVPFIGMDRQYAVTIARDLADLL